MKPSRLNTILGHADHSRFVPFKTVFFSAHVSAPSVTKLWIARADVVTEIDIRDIIVAPRAVHERFLKPPAHDEQSILFNENGHGEPLLSFMRCRTCRANPHTAFFIIRVVCILLVDLDDEETVSIQAQREDRGRVNVSPVTRFRVLGFLGIWATRTTS